MDDKKYISIDNETIDNLFNNFLTNNKSNPFYDKNIFFTQELRTTKYIEFQIIENLSGWSNDYEFSTETDNYFIADSLINDFRTGKTNEQLEQRDKKINSKGKKHEKLILISEAVFLQLIKNRSGEIAYNVTLDLIN